MSGFVLDYTVPRRTTYRNTSKQRTGNESTLLVSADTSIEMMDVVSLRLGVQTDQIRALATAIIPTNDSRRKSDGPARTIRHDQI